MKNPLKSLVSAIVLSIIIFDVKTVSYLYTSVSTLWRRHWDLRLTWLTSVLAQVTSKGICISEGRNSWFGFCHFDTPVFPMLAMSSQAWEHALLLVKLLLLISVTTWKLQLSFYSENKFPDLRAFDRICRMEGLQAPMLASPQDGKYRSPWA